MSEDAKKRLKDLAKQVREKVTPQGAPLLDKRGLELVDDMAKELGLPDGMPGLRVSRDGKTKLRLTRPMRNAEIEIEWQREIAAVAITSQRHGEPKNLVRYVWDDGQSKWRRLEGGGEIWDDLMTALVEVLYPEARKAP
jgi:hypothetical protein